MLSILTLSPLSNAPACLLYILYLSTIAEFMAHDHEKQRQESYF